MSNLTRQELNFLVLLIDEVASRGAFKPAEFGDIYKVYSKLVMMTNNGDDSDDSEENSSSSSSSSSDSDLYDDYDSN